MARNKNKGYLYPPFASVEDLTLPSAKIYVMKESPQIEEHPYAGKPKTGIYHRNTR